MVFVLFMDSVSNAGMVLFYVFVLFIDSGSVFNGLDIVNIALETKSCARGCAIGSYFHHVEIGSYFHQVKIAIQSHASIGRVRSLSSLLPPDTFHCSVLTCNSK